MTLAHTRDSGNELTSRTDHYPMQENEQVIRNLNDAKRLKKDDTVVMGLSLVDGGCPKFCRMRLNNLDFLKPGLELAKFLLGKVIYRVLGNGDVLSGRIVETEAYLGEIDKACHTYGGKRTDRTRPMFMDPGTAYVYFIYGMYFCLNVSSKDTGGCVLIRALQPITGEINS